jgi:hypothetical protein
VKSLLFLLSHLLAGLAGLLLIDFEPLFPVLFILGSQNDFCVDVSFLLLVFSRAQIQHAWIVCFVLADDLILPWTRSTLRNLLRVPPLLPESKSQWFLLGLNLGFGFLNGLFLI